MVLCLILQGVGGPSGHDDYDDDVEFEPDIGYDEYQQESLDRHWMVTAKTFDSEGEAHVSHNKYAKECGFNITRDLMK